MTQQNVFVLSQIIKAAGTDPSEITEAVWAAGYRRPARTAEEAVTLTLDIIAGFDGNDLPWSVWPKSYDDILKCELNEIIEEALHAYKTAHSIAGKLLIDGYDKVVTNDAPPASMLQAPDGWKLVPIVRTRQMMSQGHFALGGTDRGKFRRIYQAMIEAAPEVGK